MIRRFGFGLSILLLLAVLVGGITFWVVMKPTATSAEHPAGPSAPQLDRETKAQLDREINLPPTPQYSYDASSDASASAISCEPGIDSCVGVITMAYSAEELASITQKACNEYLDDESLNVSIEFYGDSPADPVGTSYCFLSKDDLVATLGERLDHAELLGTVKVRAHSSQLGAPAVPVDGYIAVMD